MQHDRIVRAAVERAARETRCMRVDRFDLTSVAHLLMISYSLREIAQQVVGIAKIAAGSTLGGPVGQFSHQFQVFPDKKKKKTTQSKETRKTWFGR